MDLGLSEIQKMLQESSRSYLEENCTMDFIRAMETDDIGISDEIWKNMAEMGWLGLMIPEEYGGSGFNFEDMSILLEEMGRVCLSGPFFSTAVIGVQALLLSGDETQKNEILSKISTGKLKISLAFNESTGSFDESEINNLHLEEKECNRRLAELSAKLGIAHRKFDNKKKAQAFFRTVRKTATDFIRIVKWH